ncbi:MAG: hypothetical protein SGJ24_03470 [Chloroflexota bacterium]|nr:hypothetical protein [Chloroflexota bacterium]
MDTPVGWILIILAAGVVAAMVWAVSRERHTHEEHYNPDMAGSASSSAMPIDVDLGESAPPAPDPTLSPYGSTIAPTSDQTKPDSSSTTEQR